MSNAVRHLRDSARRRLFHRRWRRIGVNLADRFGQGRVGGSNVGVVGESFVELRVRRDIMDVKFVAAVRFLDRGVDALLGGETDVIEWRLGSAETLDESHHFRLRAATIAGERRHIAVQSETTPARGALPSASAIETNSKAGTFHGDEQQMTNEEWRAAGFVPALANSVSTDPERASTIRGTNARNVTFAAGSVSHKPRRGVFLLKRTSPC